MVDKTIAGPETGRYIGFFGRQGENHNEGHCKSFRLYPDISQTILTNAHRVWPLAPQWRQQKPYLPKIVALRHFLRHSTFFNKSKRQWQRFPSASTMTVRCGPCGTTRTTSDGSRCLTSLPPSTSKKTTPARATTGSTSRPSYAVRAAKWLVSLTS